MATLTELARLKLPAVTPLLVPPPGQYAIPAAGMAVLPVFNTAEAFASATGLEAPPADATRPRKEWMDNSAVKLDANGRILNPSQRLTYVGVEWEEDLPVVRSLTMTVLEALRPNLPTGVSLGTGEDPNRDLIITAPAVPIPIRLLAANERIARVPGPMGGWWCVNMDLEAAAGSQVDSFTVRDRELLRSIAEKLGVGFPKG